MLNPTSNTTIQITSQNFVSALQAGRSYSGIVRAQPDGLVALIGRIQVPLDTSTGLEAGQRILVQVQAQGDGLQLSIRPQATSGSPNPLAVSTLLASILQSAGRSDLARQASILLPRQAPTNAAALRALVSLLLSERGTGQDIQQLQQFIASATNQGILSPDAGAALSPWLALTALADAAAWQDLLRRSRSERNAIARLARLVGGKNATGTVSDIRSSLGSLTQRLLDDQAFQTWLRDQGSEESFKALSERVLDRATGRDVQNLRSLDQPYQFLELPLPKEQGFLRLQLHFFSEGGQHSEKSPDGVHRTVLDLDLTNLGPLWVDLRCQGHQCQCQFRVSSPALVASLETSASELEVALAALGYTKASVTVEAWDGDHESALLSLLTPYQALNLEA